MQIRTPLDLGLAIRDRRRKLKLSQTDLARKAGVGRQWVVAIEHGKTRAELGLVLRTLSALGLSLTVDAGDRLLRSRDDITPVDIDAVVRAARAERK
jgi:HTH-type transcriptional regulator/antitoxin HipB